MAYLDKRILIDSSVWIAYFDRDDSHTERAKNILKEYTADSFVLLLTDYVIQEVVTVLLYKNKPTLVERFIEYLDSESSIEIVSIDAHHVRKTIQFAKTKNWRPKLSLTDWSLFFLAMNLPIYLATFDGQLDHACRKKI